MAVAKEKVKVNSKKKSRVAQEKRNGFVSQTTAGKSVSPRKNAGETFMYLLIFGLVSVLFLNFIGIVKIPFLQFLRAEEKGASEQTQGTSQNVVPSQAEEQKTLYQGPQLKVLEKQEDNFSEEKLETEKEKEVTKMDDGIEVTVKAETLKQENQGGEGSQLTVAEESSGEVVPASESIHRIAKICSAMEPQEAVRILEKFSDEEVVMILSSMKERQVAEILKAFPVDRAVEIARKMMKGR